MGLNSLIGFEKAENNNSGQLKIWEPKLGGGHLQDLGPQNVDEILSWVKKNEDYCEYCQIITDLYFRFDPKKKIYNRFSS